MIAATKSISLFILFNRHRKTQQMAFPVSFLASRLPFIGTSHPIRHRKLSDGHLIMLRLSAIRVPPFTRDRRRRRDPVNGPEIIIMETTITTANQIKSSSSLFSSSSRYHSPMHPSIL